MNTTQVQSFLEAAKTLNFTAAASGLYLTQSTLSKSIGSLENELGVQLFFRSHQGIRLTPGGKVLYQYLSQQPEQFQKAVHDAILANQGLTGSLRIGHLCTQHINQSLAKYIAYFDQQYESVHVSIQYAGFHSLLKELRSGEIDIAISTTFNVAGEPDLEYRKVVRIKDKLFIPNSYTFRRKELNEMTDITLKDLSEEIFLTLSTKETERITPMLYQTCKQAGFEPHTLEAPDFETLMLWLELGRGIFPLNEEHTIYFPEQIRVLELPEFPPITLSVAWLKQVENPSVSLFIQELPGLKEDGINDDLNF